MKNLGRWLVAGVLFFSQAMAVEVWAQDAAPVGLRGIMSFSGSKRALLEITNASPVQRDLILGEGERDGEVEVTSIDLAEGRVVGRIGQKQFEASLPSPAPDAIRVSSTVSGAGAGRIWLDKAGPGFVFPIYQQLAQRTLLRAQTLPDFKLSLFSPGPVMEADVLGAIVTALAAKGIYLYPDRDKFSVATKDPDLRHLPVGLWELAEKLNKGRVHSQTNRAGAEDILPAGVVNLLGTDLNQVLMIYQELAGQTLVRPSTLPSSSIFLRTFTPLSRAEALYAFQGCLFLNGVSIFPAFDKLLLVLPEAQASEASAMIQRAEKATGPVAESGGELAAGTVNLWWADARQLATMYQKLSGQKVELADDLPALRFALKSQTALSSREALQALNLLLACNRLEVVALPPGEGIKIVRR